MSRPPGAEAEVEGVHVRFAPSPTGRLHPGNARTALVNALFARRHGGRFTLRIDDTDPAREQPGAVTAITDDLAWLGFRPDAVERQSDRFERYDCATQRLLDTGAAYLWADAVRLRLDDAVMTWDDAVHGAMRVALEHQNDPVLKRADGRPTYTLASVVDDIELGITHVIRGDDHLTNTAVHLKLTAALGAPVPVFAHLPLVVDASGAPLSKRDDAVALATLRDAGVEPEPLVAYLAGLGTGRTLAPDTDPAAALELRTFGRAAPRFDPAELARAQARWFEALGVDAANARLEAKGAPPVDAALWTAIHGNLTGAGAWAELPTFDGIAAWRRITDGPLEPAIAAADRVDLATAAELLADDGDPHAWLDAVAEATGRRGKKLRLPIRRALSARSDGPPLADLLALIGTQRARRRLLGETA